MFRDLLRINQKLSFDDCIDLLVNEKRGVLSVFGDKGYPYGFPMNHYFNVEDGCIYFHCGKQGHKLDSIKNNSKVSFCVYEQGVREDGEWAFNVRSVVVFGCIEVIDDVNKVSYISEKLSRKFTNDEKYIFNEIKTSAEYTLLLKLKPVHICGKTVKEA